MAWTAAAELHVIDALVLGDDLDRLTHAVEEVVGQHVLRIAHSGQVVDPVPFQQQVLVVEQLLDLRVCQRQAQRRQAPPQRLFKPMGTQTGT